MEIKNKVILITGSSSGIGKETAILFAKQGAKVIITYNKNKSSALSVFKECSKYSKCFLVQLKLSQDNSIKKSLKTIKEKFGAVDILINNAGVLYDKPLLEQSVEEIEEQININLTSQIKITKLLLPELQKSDEALIINISSIAGKRAHEGFTAYSASKFGVRGFTQALTYELPDNVRIYCVNPGLTATPMTNFHGVSTKVVAKKILETALEILNKKSGDDIDLEEYS